MSNKLAERLVEKYKEIYSKNGQPKVMFNLKPSIPFVGNKYFNTNPKILSYASAENLSYAYVEDNNKKLKPNNSEIHQLNEEQFNRARYFYKNNKGYFPHVHSEPFNNGSQLLITRHILNKLGYENKFDNSPYDFIEQIAVANPGKFSIEVKKNKDYASDVSKMLFSIDYIVDDFCILMPEIVILPKTVFRTINRIKKWDIILKAADVSNINFILIYQLSFFNNHRVNNEIKGLNLPNDTEYPYVDWLNKIKNNKVDVAAHFTWVNYKKYRVVNIKSN